MKLRRLIEVEVEVKMKVGQNRREK